MTYTYKCRHNHVTEKKVSHVEPAEAIVCQPCLAGSKWEAMTVYFATSQGMAAFIMPYKEELCRSGNTSATKVT